MSHLDCIQSKVPYFYKYLPLATVGSDVKALQYARNTAICRIAPGQVAIITTADDTLYP